MKRLMAVGLQTITKIVFLVSMLVTAPVHALICPDLFLIKTSTKKTTAVDSVEVDFLGWKKEFKLPIAVPIPDSWVTAEQSSSNPIDNDPTKKSLDKDMPAVQKTEAGIVYTSSVMEEILEQVDTVAPLNIPVLLQGDSGTGKELLAKEIHIRSGRGAYEAVNCAQFTQSENLLESVLFGYEKGAFTDAKSKQIGVIERLAGGTVFLDEIGDLSLPAQTKLLRFLESGEITPIGGKPRKVSVRVIYGTNRDLVAMVSAGTFRKDLYYRLARFIIHLPLLKDHREDIVPLANNFLSLFSEDQKIDFVPQLDPEAQAFITNNLDWPGNIRELRNFVEQTMIKNLSRLRIRSIITLEMVQKVAAASRITTYSSVQQTTVDNNVEESPSFSASLPTSETSDTADLEILANVSEEELVNYLAKKSADRGEVDLSRLLESLKIKIFRSVNLFYGMEARSVANYLGISFNVYYDIKLKQMVDLGDPELDNLIDKIAYVLKNKSKMNLNIFLSNVKVKIVFEFFKIYQQRIRKTATQLGVSPTFVRVTLSSPAAKELLISN